MNPSAVLVHVPDVAKGLEWYKKAFPEAVPIYHPDFDFTALDINGFSLEIVQADKKVGAGKSGTVVYWSVDNLCVALAQFEELGACLYRGPMEIEDGLSMCQVEDPFGNLIGLRGKTT
ncbi:glyoxalase/bleomycin resistance/dioxygenase family protein [Vibrio vulnificus]|uniref:glyoxalase/bleomycin resistance/dioxygenase family protein n=1 Tax=Vibrio vulnificus TaxID=672 RepID=UPI001E56C3D9|nr:glyoxalase/bleomycin resistance/dioxygenase family protein [Vibrio vulnificus]MCD1409651.1 glyoxalase/bleomycin resistance/dioxygenase family protein [Vibrio vulnificus]MCD1418713.1 glyoxalase/bleomycin resistance/dioxygenase family protein [Vibrio vulnificus]MCD1422747.1 glyoxalase/bleomycin resistance/dioxygenase family protein [Vibrio vulnificus]MCD1437900.1 glyoxalase/bleomycin resistance/dioxygenase family protein [Vibrio vulnificus]MCD1442738.1 glyoxalase/bleomycin resistance/dioxygen